MNMDEHNERNAGGNRLFTMAFSALEAADDAIGQRRREAFCGLPPLGRAEREQRGQASLFVDLLDEPAAKETGSQRTLGTIRKQESLHKKIRAVFANAEEHERFRRYNPDPSTIPVEGTGRDREISVVVYRVNHLGLPGEKFGSLCFACRPAEDIIKSGFFLPIIESVELTLIADACSTRKSKPRIDLDKLLRQVEELKAIGAFKKMPSNEM